MSQDPRAQVRDMIADKLRYCPTGLFNITAMADWLMDLFRDVWLHHTVNGVCYVLRTAPTGQSCRHCGDALADMRLRVIALHREEITAAGRVVGAARAVDASLCAAIGGPDDMTPEHRSLAQALAAFDAEGSNHVD